MTGERLDAPAIEDPTSRLAEGMIDEFLRARGLTRSVLNGLETDQVQRIWKEAAIHAAIKLTEIESRSHYVHDIHGAP